LSSSATSDAGNIGFQVPLEPWLIMLYFSPSGAAVGVAGTLAAGGITGTAGTVTLFSDAALVCGFRVGAAIAGVNLDDAETAA
jgi:hypothetical protein